MYKIILSAMLWFGGSIYACDICGCSAGGNYFGILPGFQQNFVGLRYQYQSFSSSPHHAVSGEELGSNEYFKTTELWGRYVVNKHLQVFAFVPFHKNKQEVAEKTTQVQGLGDIKVIVNYIILNNDSSCKKWKHLLQIGGGVKLPSGKHDILQNGLMINQNLQPGTGSFDFPVNAIYTLRRKQLGLNTEVNYSINSTNNQHYKFGDRFSVSPRLLFYWKKTKDFILLPGIGITCEKTMNDKRNSINEEFTGGQTLLANAGFDIYYRKISFGISIKKLMYENINAGYVNTNQRISTNFIYLF